MDGLDCSGFVKWAFRNASGGKCNMMDDPKKTNENGTKLEYQNCTEITWDEAQPGDLVFYREKEKDNKNAAFKYTHVGIILSYDRNAGQATILHSSRTKATSAITGKNIATNGVDVTREKVPDNKEARRNKNGKEYTVYCERIPARPYWYDETAVTEEITLNPIIDPSGYVCEAVPSNRLEGVTATVYCRYQNPDTEEMETVLWDAEEYDQTNPLTTDANGSYAWDVPIGEWQVRFEKDGYQSAASEWLPVPPPQTEVNAALVSNAVPQLSAASAYENEIRLEFSQYMRPETVNAERVHVTADGNAVPGEVLPVNLEASFDDPSISYASVYRFVPEIDLEGEIAITVDAAVENYAGAVMKEAATKTAFVERKPLSLSAPKNVEIDADSSQVVEVKVLPEGAGLNRKIIVSSSVPGMINAEDGMTDSKWSLDKTESNVKTYKPEFTAPPKATYIETVNVNGQEIQATVSSSDSYAMIFCAIYNDSGKMIAMRYAKITSELNYQFQFDGQQFDYAKVFIVDSDFRPLCKSKKS